MMPIGNYLFNGYAQDNNEPGSGIDQFWINVTDSAQGVTDLSMPNPGISNLINISGGNIIIPHTKSEAATKPTIKLK
jgi:hypothetical protein